MTLILSGPKMRQARNVSAVGGSTLTDGASFTVNVSNSLSGATTVFDDCSGSASVLDLWDQIWHDAETSQWSEARRAVNSSDIPSASRVSLPHTNNLSKLICGAQQSSIGGIYAADVIVTKEYTRPTLPYYSTWAWWERCTSNWQFDVNDHNFKWFGFSCGNNGIYGGCGASPARNWYLSYWTSSGAGFSPVDTTSDVNEEPNDDSVMTVPYFHGHAYDDGSVPNYFGNWIYRELLIKYSDTSSGYIQAFSSSFPAGRGYVRSLNYPSGTTDPYDTTLSTFRSEGVGGYSRDYPHDENWRYWADVYFDLQSSDDTAIVITNNATYTSSTKFAHQPRTSRTASTITCRCRKGIHSSGTVHVHARSLVNGNSYVGSYTMT